MDCLGSKSTCPIISFYGDVLSCGTGGSDASDGGLVEGDHEGLVHVVVWDTLGRRKKSRAEKSIGRLNLGNRGLWM